MLSYRRRKQQSQKEEKEMIERIRLSISKTTSSRRVSYISEDTSYWKEQQTPVATDGPLTPFPTLTPTPTRTPMEYPQKETSLRRMTTLADILAEKPTRLQVCTRKLNGCCRKLACRSCSFTCCCNKRKERLKPPAQARCSNLGARCCPCLGPM